MKDKDKRIKRKAFWYGWVKDAAIHFGGLTGTAILNRLERGEPALIEWLTMQLERRKQSKVKATELVTEYTPKV